MLDPRDLAILNTCPVIAAPRFGPLPATPCGQRVVVAQDGIYLHTLVPWLDCVERIGSTDYSALPYGTVYPYVRFAFGSIPPALVGEFIDLARTQAPNECAASMVYSCATGTLNLRECHALDCSPSHIVYQHAVIGPDELVAVDLHSHGTAPAFFSKQDNNDDQGIHISIVVGSVTAAQPNCVCRLVINGHYLPLPPPWPPTRTPGCEPLFS